MERKNNIVISHHLRAISDISKNMIKELDVFIMKDEPSEVTVKMFEVLLQTNYNVNRMSLALMTLVEKMEEMNIKFQIE